MDAIGDAPQPPAQGVLIVVATPIGNLQDLPPRAAEALRTADLVLAEDTRRSGRLLAHVGADVRMRSLHDHNERERIAEVLEAVAAGDRIVLVSDAGTPTVSDPGYLLIRAAIEAGVDVAAIPGPSAVIHALTVSGLPTDRFVFEGFLPRKGRARRDRLAAVATEARTIVLFASPHRAADDLTDLADACGPERRAALCRELTKLHEEVRRGSLGALASLAVAEPVRGEVTLVVAGAAKAPMEVPPAVELARLVAAREVAGENRKDAIAAVARDTGSARRAVYQAVVDARSSSGD